MALVKQSTARNRMVFMVDETDHVSGLAGLTLTITASKDGAAFGSISPTVTDRGSGWYNLALTTSHTDTLGDLALHITSTGADPTDLIDEVVVDLPGTSTGAAAALTATVADSVPAITVRPSVASGILMLQRFLMAKRVVVGNTMTVTKEDNTTPSMTFTLDAIPPTSTTRAS